MTTLPSLPVDVELATETDVEELGKRFEIFEALHHSMSICNPMSEEDLDLVVKALEPTDGHRVLDIACGYGELLFRLAQQATIVGKGLDLSPWMIAGAAERSAQRVPDANLTWAIGEGRFYGLPGDDVQPWDRTCCLGASWIWQGMRGTFREVMSRTVSGGRIAVGDLRLRDGCDPHDVAQTHGRVFTAAEADVLLEEAGANLITRVDTTDASWAAYLDRTRSAALAWQARHPGTAADGYVEEQQSWVSDHARDREILTWSVWIAEVG